MWRGFHGLLVPGVGRPSPGTEGCGLGGPLPGVLQVQGAFPPSLLPWPLGGADRGPWLPARAARAPWGLGELLLLRCYPSAVYR